MFGFSILLWKIWMKYLLMWSLHFQHFVIQPSLVLQQSCLSLVTLLLFSCSVVSNSLGPHGLQHTRLSCPPLFPRACSNSHPLSQWCHPTISSSVTPSFPPLNLSQHQGLFQRVGSSHQVAKMLVLQLQHWSSHLSFPLQLKLTFLGKTSLTSSPTLLESSFIVTNSSSVLPD